MGNVLYDDAALNGIIGKILTEFYVGGDTINLKFLDGSEFNMYHDQDCCENVSIDDITGDFEDLVAFPILVAEERSNVPEPVIDRGYPPESYTWTFYTIRSLGGSVDIRWYGESNGYYSERVSCSLDNRG